MEGAAVGFDRLFAPDYLLGLQERTLEELRAMRDECDRAETAVSYLRRVAQGRLDIVQGALANTDSTELSTLVEQLPALIGGGPPRPSGPGRLPTRMAPDDVDIDTSEIDAVLDAGRIGHLPTMSDEELRHVAQQLIEVEGRISQQRKMLHERIDAVQGEIVARYKSGQASADGLLG
ncbi:MAG: RsiG family protein [Acidimicrobiales bacterium]